MDTKFFRIPYRYTVGQDTRCKYKRSVDARSRNHCCREIEIIITYSECVSVALVIQHAKRMRRILLSSMACLALQYVYTVARKRHVFFWGGMEGRSY